MLVKPYRKDVLLLLLIMLVTWSPRLADAAYKTIDGWQGGTGLSTFAAKGAILNSTSASALQALQVGANNQTLIADSTQTGGIRYDFMHTAPSGVFLPNLKYRRLYITNIPSGTTDVPSPAGPAVGKRWMVTDGLWYNAGSAGDISSSGMSFKTSGSYYPLSASTVNVNTNQSSRFNPSFLPILENGDTLATTSTGAGMCLTLSVLEFDATSAIRTVKSLALVAGNNTLYTAPSSGACLVGTGSTANNLILGQDTAISYFNDSGGSRTVYANAVSSGDVPDAPSGTSGINNALGTTQTIGSNTGTTIGFVDASLVPSALNAGDSINLNTDAAPGGTQAAWLTVIEGP